MRIHLSQRRAFARRDLIAVMVAVGLLATLAIMAVRKQKPVRDGEQCVNNLMQIGLAFRVYANDHEDRYPMSRYARFNPAREATEDNDLYSHFQALSNVLSSPKYLLCPTDSRIPAGSFSVLKNNNISYFVGLAADESKPASLLTGDRNIDDGSGSMQRDQYIMQLKEATIGNVEWTAQFHGNCGNIGSGDGSVSYNTTPRLRALIKHAFNSGSAAELFDWGDRLRLQLPGRGSNLEK